VCPIIERVRVAKPQRVDYRFESRTAMRYTAMSWVRPLFGERGRGLLCIIWLTVSSVMGPKINAR
jgi:hypothetical protein